MFNLNKLMYCMHQSADRRKGRANGSWLEATPTVFNHQIAFLCINAPKTCEMGSRVTGQKIAWGQTIESFSVWQQEASLCWPLLPAVCCLI